MSKRPRVYFAHPMSLYHSLTERVIIEAMRRTGYEVINPSAEIYQRDYQATLDAQTDVDPMKYWIELAGGCDACVFSPFPREHVMGHVPYSNRPFVSAGVVKEVKRFIAQKRRVEWVLPDAKRPEDVIFHTFSSWREFNKLSVPDTETILRAQGVKIG
jgi:hypothetical protein